MSKTAILVATTVPTLLAGCGKATTNNAAFLTAQPCGILGASASTPKTAA